MTGGSGDVNPQLLTTQNINAPADGSVNEIQVALPVTRSGGCSKTKTTVFELLKIFVSHPFLQGTPPNTPTTYITNLDVCTAPNTAALGPTSLVVGGSSVAYRIQNSGASWAVAVISEQGVDLTDGAGHGILIATDYVWIKVNTVNFTALSTFGCKLLYRLKEVGLTEYMGILQSQTSR